MIVVFVQSAVCMVVDARYLAMALNRSATSPSRPGQALA